MHVVVFITAKDKEEARKISDRLVGDKLVACVNIVDPIESIFRWEGKVDRSSEALLILKTRKFLFKKLIKAVKSVHSYSVPEIIALPIVDGNKDYLKWINDSTKPNRKISEED